MPLMKYAYAAVAPTRVHDGGWDNVRVAAASPRIGRSLSDQASNILGQEFNPANFLLSHCTIVASVDTVPVPGLKLGASTYEGRKVVRKTTEFRIKPECERYVNNNFDSWARPVLLKSYKTFSGAFNFLEHVQIENLSKGRILDAVARDIGDSVYVDILIATDRKHTELIKDIESGELSTLSMGCFLPGTQVSLADGTRVAIEDVQVGDMVLTHKGRSREVLNKQIRGGKWGVRRIEAVGVPSAITATDIHPFFVLDEAGGSVREVQAQHLRVGDLLCNPGCTAGTPITSIEAQTYEGWVHDMEVEEDHSYVVEGVAVHNCSIDGSTCTQCGHWAADETEFCDHIRHFKGNTFFDEKGAKHRIAELCGDVTLDPTGGVQFIEASWVKVPAFKGAVARNLITLSSDDKGKTAKRIQKVVGTPAPKVPADGYLKAARRIHADEFGLDGAGEDAAKEPEAPPEPADPLKGITDDLKKYVLDNLAKSLKEDLSKSDLTKALLPPEPSTAPNDTVVKQARAKRAAYLSRVRSIVRTASTDRDLVQKIARLNREHAIFVPVILYRTALKVGGSHRYASLSSFLGGCQKCLGRYPTVGEARTLIRLAKLITTRSVGVTPKKP